MIKIQWLASIWFQNDQSNAKLQTRSNYDEFASIWRPNDQNCWVLSQNIQNNAKLHKWSKYNDLHRFDVKNIKTTHNYKNYQITWIASIWCPNDQNNAKLQKRSKYNDLHRYDVKSDQITMNCIDITSKWLKMLLCRKTFETTENYKSDQIGRQNEQKCWVTSQNIQNYSKLRKWSNYNELRRFDVKTI